MLLPLLCASLSFPGGPPQETGAPVVVVDRDNVTIDRSCTVRIDGPIVDADGNGVVHIVGDALQVDFDGQSLRGAAPSTDADAFTGIGVTVRGREVVVRNARIAGFRVGIHARNADALVLEHCDVSGNFRQRLGSTPEREDPADWLWPHANDDGEWQKNYGAGILIESSAGVTVRRCRARNGQNGLLLDRVERSLVYDNDFSFLSGWGIALWRSSRNAITRNALDFNIRGYSHGVYNRGQDSAGLLLFEQCSQNVIAENSATHCGDGLFAFAGKQALGEGEADSDLEHTRLGNNDNLIAANDFSYAAAHGLELTFSFGNRIFANRFVGNAICGIWGGYSRDSLIAENLFARNGDAGYGDERGGVNIEHGQRNVVFKNRFEANACGVRLWWDDDAALRELPWVVANGFGSGDNLIIANEFRADARGIELVLAGRTTLAENRFLDVPSEIERDERSPVFTRASFEADWSLPEYPVFGETQPIGARSSLAGREHILVDGWGPYDGAHPALLRVASDSPAEHRYRVGGPGAEAGTVTADGDVTVTRDGPRRDVVVRGTRDGALPYELVLQTGGESVRVAARLVRLTPPAWSVRFFDWTVDPREDVEAWRREADGADELTLGALDFDFGGNAPGNGTDVGKDRFGTLATARVALPAGEWIVRTASDDGIRLWVDDRLVIDDWTHHATRTHEAPLRVEAAREHVLRVEHFELDGAAALRVEFDAP